MFAHAPGGAEWLVLIALGWIVVGAPGLAAAGAVISRSAGRGRGSRGARIG